jgi:hypothetical protein
MIGEGVTEEIDIDARIESIWVDSYWLNPYATIGRISGTIAGWLTFIGAWGYCVATYGFLFGFGLGWLPALILSWLVAWATSFLWDRH